MSAAMIAPSRSASSSDLADARPAGEREHRGLPLSLQHAHPAADSPKYGALFGSIRPYRREWLSRDVVAGITLAALAIPEVMGYTKIAGTPVITGLYTILLPVLLFALLGSSRHLVVGADSATAAILATGLLATGAVAGSPQYTQLASLT